MSRLSPNKLRKGLAALALAGAIASGAAGMASHAVWASDMEISRVSDQGTPIHVDPEIFGIQGRDRTWNHFAQSFISANRPQFQALELQPTLVPAADQINLYLKPGGTIGAVPLRSPTTRKISGGVIVHPRFGWRDIGPVLQEIGWTASPHLLEMPLVPHIESLLQLEIRGGCTPYLSLTHYPFSMPHGMRMVGTPMLMCRWSKN